MVVIRLTDAYVSANKTALNNWIRRLGNGTDVTMRSYEEDPYPMFNELRFTVTAASGNSATFTEYNVVMPDWLRVDLGLDPPPAP